MNGKIPQFLAICALALFSVACTWTPPHIRAVEVSLDRYEAHACEQITEQMDAAAERANELYQGFVEVRKSNSWKLAAAILIFSPFALLMEMDDEAEVEEYAQLKGEYEALRFHAGKKSCEVSAVLLEEEMGVPALEDEEEDTEEDAGEDASL